MARTQHRSDPRRRHRRARWVFAVVVAHVIISALVTAGAIGPTGSSPTIGGPVTVLGGVVDRVAPVSPPVDRPSPLPPVAAPPEPPPEDGVGGDLALGPAAADMVSRINELRASVGVAPLAVDRELTERALAWAATMGAGGDIRHQGDLSIGLGADWWRLGENVGYGAGVGPIHDGFVLSPTHYANLVDPGFTSIGVGVVEVGGRLYVAEEFMELSS